VDHAGQPFDEFAADVRRWARQTILFTLQFGMSAPENQSAELAQIRRVSDESAAVMNELWSTAQQGDNDAQRGNVDPTEAIREFIRCVLDWTSRSLPEIGNAR
jgi:hypothetical protein